MQPTALKKTHTLLALVLAATAAAAAAVASVTACSPNWIMDVLSYAGNFTSGTGSSVVIQLVGNNNVSAVQLQHDTCYHHHCHM
jgi:mannose/fructose/N-acetylgalactosamine-specific phosphotransferase system component IIC